MAPDDPRPPRAAPAPGADARRRLRDLSPEDTIVGLATPPGIGAVAVLRLSGPRAREVAASLVRVWPRPREVALRTLRGAEGRVLDRALVLWMPGPRSFTGEDVVELHTHGGRVVPGQVLTALQERGARLAEPGEFSRRAFLAGRLSLDEAEALNDLVHAGSEEFAAEALAQLDGSLRRRVDDLREGLLELAAGLEAELDHPEEELETGSVQKRRERAEAIEGAVRALAGTYDRGRLLRDGARVALVGLPNVGKSSLLNALLGVERALVTEEAGTTRDVVEESLRVRGRRLRLQDTAGLRPAPTRAEALGVERARSVAGEAEVRLLVTEAGHPLTPEEAEWLSGSEPGPTLLVRNKRDRVPAGEDRMDFPPGIVVLPTSALTGEGIEELLEAILGVVDELVPARREPGVVVTNLRHREALERAGESLAGFRRALGEGLPPDVAMVELYEALEALGAVIGSVGVEDVLDAVFSRFCLGK